MTATLGLDRVPSLIGDKAGHRAVFVNGRFRAEMSAWAACPKAPR